MRAALTLLLTVLVLMGGALALWLGERGAAPAEAGAPAPVEAPPPRQAYVLAISWHSAFCETKPGLDECRRQKAGDYTADHFALHGLWPQDGEYCGVSDRLVSLDRANRWSDLPKIEVSDATRRELVRLMPGSAEQLERHEWLYHGTCAGVSAETYFRRAIALTEAVNASAVRELLADNIGRRVTSGDIRAAFDKAFGKGAGRKVRVDCEADGKRDLLAELRINLDGEVMGSAGLAELIKAGRTISVGCPGGIVDRPGQQ